MTPGRPPRGATRLGLDQNLEGALCYSLGPLTGVLFLLAEPENQYVRFHARQCLLFVGVVAVLGVLTAGVPVIGGKLFLVPVVVLWAVLMFKAINGDRYKLPFIGEWAEQRPK